MRKNYEMFLLETFFKGAKTSFSRQLGNMKHEPEAATEIVLIQKMFLKIFANFTGKYLCWSLFLIKLQAFRPTTLPKRGSKTGVFQ